jgi:transposase
MRRAYGTCREGKNVEAAKELPPCPGCGESLSYVLEYVTEQREYHFSLTQNEYVGYSDPVDDTSNLDYVACPHCFRPLPEPFVERLSELFDAFSTAP